jgi:plastocyanin
MNNIQKILSWIMVSTILSSVLTFQLINAQVQSPESDINSTSIAAVITITKDKEGNTVFSPQLTTIKQDEEILIKNNDTVVHSFINGENPQDPMAGKIFDSGQIPPKESAEYLADNADPGNYTFYTTTNPNVTGQLSILQK